MYPFDQQKLASLMAKEKLDLALVNSRHNVRYLTGYYYHFYENFTRIGASQYLPLLGLPAKDLANTFYVGLGMERGQIETEGLWVQNRVESGRGTIGAAEQAALTINKLGLAHGRIGVETAFLPADAYLTLQKSLPQATIVDATSLLDELRAIKTDRELALLRSVNDRAAEAICFSFAHGRDGVATREMADTVRLEMERRGLRFLWCFTNAGPGYLRAPSQTRWTKGNTLHLDAGGEEMDYLADICRMGSLGKPSQLANDLHAACLDVQDKVRKMVKPGVRCNELNQEGIRVVASSPLAQYGAFVAHGMGMVSHEHPAINANNSRTLEAGMVLSVETEFLHPAVGHVKIEDAVAVTANGCEGFGDQGREWQTV